MSHDTKTYKSPQVLLFFGTHSYGKILYLDINIFHKREEYFRGKLNLRRMQCKVGQFFHILLKKSFLYGKLNFPQKTIKTDLFKYKP